MQRPHLYFSTIFIFDLKKIQTKIELSPEYLSLLARARIQTVKISIAERVNQIWHTFATSGHLGNWPGSSFFFIFDKNKK